MNFKKITLFTGMMLCLTHLNKPFIKHTGDATDYFKKYANSIGAIISCFKIAEYTYLIRQNSIKNTSHQ